MYYVCNIHWTIITNNISKAESFHNLKKQEKFLASPMGKGILLLSLSLIKYRYMDVLPTHIALGNL